MYYHEGQVHIEDEDQCSSCEFFARGVMCPLLEALAMGVAHLDGDVLVKNCGFYVPFKRHLKVIDGSTAPEASKPPENADVAPIRLRKSE